MPNKVCLGSGYVLIMDPWKVFGGILKSEMYYLQKFHTYQQLEKAIYEYIKFYNTKRIQKKLKGMAPLEYNSHVLAS
ncbi:IS3 family transposase [Clostridium butyricum]|uniref:IS3 family transposase n=1 Tax=Clostridium butyricum TaxID=1492 RepID=UPI00168B87B8|nr:IS3 family transposase [Clostridium butyricum]MDB2152295.1 IS3 family transposase [Clostridium butyricum]